MISFVSNGQYLNDTTLHGGKVTSYNSAFEVDTGYFVSGMIGHDVATPKAELLLGFWGKDGSHTSILENYEASNNQYVHSSFSKLQLNDNGNFVYSFLDCSTGCYPRLKEVSTSGAILTDISFQSIYDSLGLDGYLYNNMIQKSYDSSYICLSNSDDPNLIGGYSGGLMYIHLDKQFNILDTLRFIHPTHEFHYGTGDIIELNNGGVLIMISSTNQSPTNEAHVVFKILDKDGNIVQTEYFYDGQQAELPMGLVRTSDDGYMFTYMQGFTNGNTWFYKNFLAKLDSNFDEEFKVRIDLRDTLSILDHVFQQEIKRTFDDNYVVVGGGHTDSPLLSTAMCTKFSLSGNKIWQRHYRLVENDPIYGGPAVSMKDVIQKADSGFVMVGEIKIYSPIGLVAQKGYIVETNCLGFMGEPLAASSHTVLDSFQIEFYNTSIQAGSYEWYFGDGDTLETTEYVDTLTHTYTGEGPFTVTLIANGCGNKRDTISFDVYPETFEDTTIIVDVPGNFTFYPNPVLSGQDIFLYMNALNSSDGVVECDIIDLNGKKVRSFQLSPDGGTYQIKNNLSKGLYFMQVNQGNKQLHCSKLEVI